MTNPTPAKDAIQQCADGRLELGGRILQEGEQVRVWVGDAPAQSRVVKQSRNWLIVLSDGRATGGYGLRAEIVETQGHVRVVGAAHPLGGRQKGEAGLC